MIHSPNSQSGGARLLTELEEALRAAELWSLTQPSAEALASQQPFACDTLALEQWLQFIFIPRLRAMLEANAAVPPMQLLPMAEVTWQSLHQPVQRVLASFDRWSQSLHE